MSVLIARDVVREPKFTGKGSWQKNKTHCKYGHPYNEDIHQKCNIALGMFNDNIQLLNAAIDYLRRTV